MSGDLAKVCLGEGDGERALCFCSTLCARPQLATDRAPFLFSLSGASGGMRPFQEPWACLRPSLALGRGPRLGARGRPAAADRRHHRLIRCATPAIPRASARPCAPCAMMRRHSARLPNGGARARASVPCLARELCSDLAPHPLRSMCLMIVTMILYGVAAGA